jgi:hypothetical protein
VACWVLGVGFSIQLQLDMGYSPCRSGIPESRRPYSSNPRSHLEVITGENDPDKSQRCGGITHLTINILPSVSALSVTRPPQWRTFKFLLYYVMFVIVVPWMVYAPIQFSASASFQFLPHRLIGAISYSETHPNHRFYHLG